MSPSSMLINPTEEISIFTDKEKFLIAEIINFLEARDSPFYSLLLRRKSDLEVLAVVVQHSPALTKELILHGESYSKKTLVEKIKEKRIDQVVNMPTKVILGYGFTVSLLHFWGFLVKLTYKYSEIKNLQSSAEDSYSDILFSLMAEELYRSLQTKKVSEDHITEFVASELIQLWENRFVHNTQFFAPYIKDLWEARQKIIPVLGTLAGVMELMRLNSFLSPMWNDFLEWYYSNYDDRGEALEEFLFDLSYEEIFLLRKHMKENLISAVDRNYGTEIISNLLGESPNRLREKQSRYKTPQALQLYQSFIRRQQDGMNRQRDNDSGPHQTLEELFLIFLVLKKTSMVQKSLK